MAFVSRASRGFTLIELLVTVTVVVILAMIAIPSYASAVRRSHLHLAEADLTALALNMEGYYQQQLAYPAATSTTEQTTALIDGWHPAANQYFTFQIASSTGSAYTLRATGIGGYVDGYVVTIDEANDRTVSDPDGATSSW